MLTEDQSKAGASLTCLRCRWAEAGQAGEAESNQRYSSLSKHPALKQVGLTIKYSYHNMCKHNSKHNTSPFQPHPFCKSVTITGFLFLLRPQAHPPYP